MPIEITWEGITVTVSHCSNWLNSDFDHNEVRAKERLPITTTGYRSHFIHSNELALFASPEDFVRQWLDHSAADKAWLQYLKDSQQLSLF